MIHAIQRFLEQRRYGKVATDGDVHTFDNKDDDGWSWDAQLRQFRQHAASFTNNKLAVRASVLLLAMVCLFGLKPRPASSTDASRPPTPQLNGLLITTSTTPMKRRRGVNCATRPGSELHSIHNGQQCWTPQEMARRANASGRCFFAVREPVDGELCAPSMNLVCTTVAIGCVC